MRMDSRAGARSGTLPTAPRQPALPQGPGGGRGHEMRCVVKQRNGKQESNSGTEQEMLKAGRIPVISCFCSQHALCYSSIRPRKLTELTFKRSSHRLCHITLAPNPKKRSTHLPADCKHGQLGRAPESRPETGGHPPHTVFTLGLTVDICFKNQKSLPIIPQLGQLCSLINPLRSLH